MLRLSSQGQAEIEDLGCAIFRVHDARRLQIAMQNSGGTRSRQRICDGNGVFHCFVHVEPVFPNKLLERFAAHQFHHQKLIAVFKADIVERQNVGMVESRNGARFP
jgi:hypothetical protein